MEVVLELITTELLDKPLWLWALFLLVVMFLLLFDLGVLHRKSHEMGARESLYLSAFYIGAGLAFSLVIWWFLGGQSAALYLTGFVVEKSLSLDNVFVIALIFSYFGIPKLYQHRVLIYGILGVLVLRGIMIGAGAAVVERSHWVLYFFAAFLVFTGFRMLFKGDEEYDVGTNPVLRFLRKRIRLTDTLHGDRFVVRIDGRLFATPLLLTLIMVELADLIFAVDSIPAIFSITTDPYIIYTSNIFAILGLRALFFVLLVFIDRFEHLKYALSAVLIFIGSKVFIADILGLDKFPPAVSLAITLSLLGAGVVFSLFSPKSSSRAGVAGQTIDE